MKCVAEREGKRDGRVPVIMVDGGRCLPVVLLPVCSAALTRLYASKSFYRRDDFLLVFRHVAVALQKSTVGRPSGCCALLQHIELEHAAYEESNRATTLLRTNMV